MRKFLKDCVSTLASVPVTVGNDSPWFYYFVAALQFILTTYAWIEGDGLHPTDYTVAVFIWRAGYQQTKQVKA